MCWENGGGTARNRITERKAGRKRCPQQGGIRRCNLEDRCQGEVGLGYVIVNRVVASQQTREDTRTALLFIRTRTVAGLCNTNGLQRDAILLLLERIAKRALTVLLRHREGRLQEPDHPSCELSA